MGIFNFLFGRMIDKRISDFQNDLMEKHINEVQHIYRQMRGWRHDYHNHLQAMLAFIENPNECPEGTLKDYILLLNSDLTNVDTIIKTGNIMVDAILNSKISIAKSKNITIDAKAIVPKELIVSEIDLCVIIGNLLDNAMEAAIKLPNEDSRFIRVYIDILKDRLYISVTNSVGGGIRKNGKTYYSTKNQENHGFGLMRIDKIAQKYNGYINRQNEEGVFATEIMIPISNS